MLRETIVDFKNLTIIVSLFFFGVALYFAGYIHGAKMAYRSILKDDYNKLNDKGVLNGNTWYQKGKIDREEGTVKF